MSDKQNYDNYDADEQSALDFSDIEQESESSREPTRKISGVEEKIRAAIAYDPELDDELEEDELEERDYKPIRRKRSGRTGLAGGLMYGVFVISVSIILACMGWVFASDVLALNKEEITATVTIPKDFTIGEVAQDLKDAGIIEYKFLFKLYSKISHADTKIDPGTYELNTNFDYRALVKKMQIGSESQVETQVTFPEGFTVAQIFARLEENNICTQDDLFEAAANTEFDFSFLEGIPTGDASRLEGYLFPDTYNFYEGMSAAGAIKKLLNNFNDKYTADMLDAANSRGLTLRQLLTVASMIEKEAANNDERAMIASVIYNRLSANMPLGIDATILYAYPEYADKIDEIINQESDYNTRIHTGLTPTPICNPGMASINAAVKPASTNYYYYALDTATGTHKFFANKYEFDNFVSTQNY